MLLVGIGGIFGAISRFLMGKWITSKTPATFPFGTWVINITGSFLLGLLAVLHVHQAIPDWTWLVFGTGFLGAYTTFSTFGYETITFLEKKYTKRAVIYVSTSVILGIIFAWIGGLIGNVITS
ncbi:fluoride efflux transporter CrcB [Ammoniphilus resinae]|uniref:Fluoride-specific ion channel FluC n=1 Tax=Ammoniphilus resinae TaxID=861532 RepID=A0ABS4GR60_9BACL|nr:fluoride efflux transporter CrcB [Ammoniphilus resinae]MBP1932753.1 CrcB protein [Ammoniphilus resinae]